MKKLILFAVIAFLTSCCLITPTQDTSIDLGERYDSENIWLYEFTDEQHEEYFKNSSELQFVVHEKTAIAIAEAILKEKYPEDGYHVPNLSHMDKPYYWEEENCWVVFLYKRDITSDNTPVLVFVDIDSAMIKAIVPKDK